MHIYVNANYIYIHFISKNISDCNMINEINNLKTDTFLRKPSFNDLLFC